MNLIKKSLLSAVIGLTVVGSAHAGAKPDQVDRLGKDLTPMGSVKAGNAAGTIPAWTGGVSKPIA